LDNTQVNQFQDRLRGELGDRYGADHAVVKGAPQHLRVVYYAYKLPWLPFRDPDSMLVYHQKQGTSFSLIVPFDLNTKVQIVRDSPSPGAPPQSPPAENQIGIGTNGINIRFFHKAAASQRVILGAANSAEELLERYKGFRFGYENISLGTNRLGLKV